MKRRAAGVARAARPLLPGPLPGMGPELRDPERHAAELSPLLCAWFAAARRDLPWRVNYTPYEVWISEIMLQQTQMDRAVDYYRRWMEQLPDVAALAAAPEETVLRLWEGLGHYSRARNLMAAARRIMEEHGGAFPERGEDIRALPGIGPYTAAAVASIAFGRPVACVDANVERVLSRLFDVETPARREPAATFIRQWAQRLVPEAAAREHNQAMMELGALVCRKQPRCPACPWGAYCRARQRGVAAERPVKDEGPGMTALTTVAGILTARGRILVRRRPARGVWAGLWEFPGGAVQEGEEPGAALLRHLREGCGLGAQLLEGGGHIVHTRTRYRITLHWRRLGLGESAPGSLPALPDDSWRWVTPEELASLPLPAPHRKVAALALAQ
ncbi:MULTISPECIES: A/G-specific adenine glycosylase [unclassified Desulfovibrio]|uniref:A/G-specific adenine glycosylase n=1 Tax=unclassified Desulfovibrio TaxID=2593640 RepID=UPI001F14DA1D|nr:MULTISPECIES: A/G-specific adenine glycosylase [unclassified Desulfovibrio]